MFREVEQGGRTDDGQTTILAEKTFGSESTTENDH